MRMETIIDELENMETSIKEDLLKKISSYRGGFSVSLDCETGELSLGPTYMDDDDTYFRDDHGLLDSLTMNVKFTDILDGVEEWSNYAVMAPDIRQHIINKLENLIKLLKDES